MVAWYPIDFVDQQVLIAAEAFEDVRCLELLLALRWAIGKEVCSAMHPRIKRP
jgi:hypothetical protein